LKNESYICHVVIPLRDHQKSKRFYETVFGWEVTPQPGTASLDILPPSGKGISAELNPEEDTIVPCIYTTDIKASLKKIEKLGGTVLKNKTPIREQGEHGYFALFKDPNENKLCLYSEK